METGYEKASSDNLPCVDYAMIDEFYRDSVVVEERNVKTQRSARKSYGDNAVAYVQLKREGFNCTVKGKITPEHKIRAKYYQVYAIIDEAAEKISQCKCLSCVASEGCCKHATAFLFWVLRRSEEPAVTSQTCYWKRSVRSKVGTSVKGDLSSLVSKEIPPIKRNGNSFLFSLISACSEARGGIFDVAKPPMFCQLSIYYNFLDYYTEFEIQQRNGEHFLQYVKDRMPQNVCDQVEVRTRSQAANPLWYEMRFGRITASKVYEASRCQTEEGCLMETILGATKFRLSDAMLRGQNLEEDVVKEVMKQRKIKKYRRSGIIINKFFPYFGASPDAVSEDYCIEVKCPSKKATISNYVKDGVIRPKCYAQLQLQMFMAKKPKGLFCVASLDFEITKKVSIFDVEVDIEYCRNILQAVHVYWMKAIFPKLVEV